MLGFVGGRLQTFVVLTIEDLEQVVGLSSGVGMRRFGVEFVVVGSWSLLGYRRWIFVFLWNIEVIVLEVDG